MFARIGRSNLKSNSSAEFNQKVEHQIIPIIRSSRCFAR